MQFPGFFDEAEHASEFVRVTVLVDGEAEEALFQCIDCGDLKIGPIGIHSTRANSRDGAFVPDSFEVFGYDLLIIRADRGKANLPAKTLWRGERNQCLDLSVGMKEQPSIELASLRVG